MKQNIDDKVKDNQVSLPKLEKAFVDPTRQDTHKLEALYGVPKEYTPSGTKSAYMPKDGWREENWQLRSAIAYHRP